MRSARAKKMTRRIKMSFVSRFLFEIILINWSTIVSYNSASSASFYMPSNLFPWSWTSSLVLFTIPATSTISLWIPIVCCYNSSAFFLFCIFKSEGSEFLSCVRCWKRRAFWISDSIFYKDNLKPFFCSR